MSSSSSSRRVKKVNSLEKNPGTSIIESKTINMQYSQSPQIVSANSPQSLEMIIAQNLPPPAYERKKVSLPNTDLMYEGGIQNNTLEGEGILYEKNSTGGRYVYKGEWRMGARDGQGHYNYPDGSQYKGSWRNNMKEGYGVFSSRGDRYEGEWAQNMRQGKGKLILSNGITIQGIWNNDQLVEGSINYPNGGIYEGQIRNLQRHGEGVYKYPDHSIYRGHWLNNNKSGMGDYEFSNGDRFKGQFLDSLKHGSNGRYIWKSGFELENATFQRDVYIGGNLVQSRR